MFTSRYADILDQLIEGVRAIVPVYSDDRPFNCASDAHGNVDAPFDWILDPQRTTRDFDIKSPDFQTYPDGGCMMVTEAEIRIVYEVNTDLGLLDRMIAEDTRSIVNDVIRNPASWLSAEDVSLREGEKPVADLTENPNGLPATIVLNIPIKITYRMTENVATTYRPEILYCEQLDAGTRLKVVVQVADSHTGANATEAVVLILDYWNELWAAVEPTYYPNANYPTTDRPGTDVAATLETDSNGYAEIIFDYTDVDTSLDQRVRFTDPTGVYQDTCLASLTSAANKTINVLSFAEETPHRARLCLQVLDVEGSPVTERTWISLLYQNEDEDEVLPAFWIEPSLYLSTIKTGTKDVAGTVQTDANGFCSVLFMYEGIDLAKAQEIILSGTDIVTSSTGLLAISGERVFIDSTDPNASDSPSSGTEAQPFVTIDYAFSQYTREVIADIAFCIVSDATYATWTGAIMGYNIVGLSDNIKIQGKVLHYNLYTPKRTLIRNLEILDGGATEAMEVYKFSSVFLLDIRIVNSPASFPLRINSQGYTLYAVGCSIDGAGGTYLVLNGANTSMPKYNHCTFSGTSTSGLLTGPSTAGQGFHAYDCTFSGTPGRFIYGLNAVGYMGDRNTFLGTPTAAFSLIFGTSNATLAEHQTTTGQDANSTWVP